MKKSYKDISRRYRESGKGFLSKEEVEAYVIARMPATAAAIRRVLIEIEGFRIQSVLDVGAGPGTGALVAKKVFPDVESVFLVEENPAMVENGAQLIEGEWVVSRASEVEFPKMDLAIFGYSFGEMGDLKVLERAYLASDVLVVVEAGTPRGFESVLRARDHVIGLGGELIAPCPHMGKCPNSWCHFSTRLERTKEHRAAKEGALGFEDEKFSYVIFSKIGGKRCEQRVLRHPQKRGGHVKLTLCTKRGIEQVVVSKKEGPRYKKARKLKWGDSIA